MSLPPSILNQKDENKREKALAQWNQSQSKVVARLKSLRLNGQTYVDRNNRSYPKQQIDILKAHYGIGASKPMLVGGIIPIPKNLESTNRELRKRLFAIENKHGKNSKEAVKFMMQSGKYYYDRSHFKAALNWFNDVWAFRNHRAMQSVVSFRSVADYRKICLEQIQPSQLVSKPKKLRYDQLKPVLDRTFPGWKGYQ